MAQAIGYVLAAIGPVAIGALHDWSGGWDVPLAVLLALTVPLAAAGVAAGRAPSGRAGWAVRMRARGLTRQNSSMASYTVNDAAVAKARSLIRGRQYVLDSDWGDVQPKAKDENAFMASHSWSEYAEWHLGLTEGATDETRRAMRSSTGTSAASTVPA